MSYTARLQSRITRPQGVREMTAYQSAGQWWAQKQKMNKAGKPNPPIDSVRTQCWSVTISLEENTLESVTNLFESLAEAEPDTFSGCFSEEEGSKEREDGTHYHHAQAAVHYAKKITGKKLKAIFSDFKAHLEPAKNTAALILYVQKQKTHLSGPYRFGQWEELEERNANQGKRSDLDQLDEAIANGASYTDLLLDDELNHTLDRHSKWAKDRINAIRCGRFQYERRGIDEHGAMLVNDYIWGSSGLAKSGVIQDFFGEKNVFSISEYDVGFPFDGYEGQEVLFLDEFKGDLPFKKLLKIMQGYPFKVDIKGGHTWAAWRKVIIASSVSPLELYLGMDSLDRKDGRRQQFWRRLSEGVVINANEQPLAQFYPYDNPEDAFKGITKMPKGIKGYGPDYWKQQRANLPKTFNYDYADVTRGLPQRTLEEIGYRPDGEDDDEEW